VSGNGHVINVEDRDGGGHVVQATTTSHLLATIVLADGVLGTEAGDEVIARATDLPAHMVATPKRRRKVAGRG